MKDSKILEIEIVLDKINLLFRNIQTQGEMDPVERDLLKKYTAELQNLLQGALQKTEKQIEQKVEIPVEQKEEKVPELQPEIKEVVTKVPVTEKPEIPEKTTEPEKEKKKEEPVKVVTPDSNKTKKPLALQDDPDEEDAFNTGLNTKLNREKKTLADKILNKKASDLRSVIDLNEKLFLTSELFAKDKQAYENAISELNALPDLATAERFLHQQLTQRHHWGAQHTDAIERLVELLQQKFS